MKLLISAADADKFATVHLDISVEGRAIRVIALQERNDGTFEIFHQDTFAPPADDSDIEAGRVAPHPRSHLPLSSGLGGEL